jgi:predicted TIM-barrel fold metal-dependent hydrolase
MMETTRMVTNLVLSGAADRYRKIRFIIPHTGGTLPAIVDRLASTMGFFSGKPVGPEKTYEALSRFYFDVAGPAASRTMPLLRTFASGDRILYGSDWPFTPEEPLQQLRSRLANTLGGEPDFMKAVYRLNALKLFPQFAQA